MLQHLFEFQKCLFISVILGDFFEFFNNLDPEALTYTMGDPLTTTNASQVFSTAIKNASEELHGIKPFEKISNQRFKNAIALSEWLERFERKLNTKGKNDGEKANILLDYLSPEVYKDYRTTTKITENANEYDNVKATLKNAIGLTNIQDEARRMFLTLTPKHKESTLHFIQRCKETAIPCNFTDSNAEVMAKALAMCISDKFQEKAVSANWTNANLADAEAWLVQQEQLQVRKKEISERFAEPEEGNVKEIKATASHGMEQRPCNKCNRRHSPNADCPAKFKQCLNCGLTGHFAAVCHQPNQNNPRGFQQGPQMQRGQWRGGRYPNGQGRGSFQNLRVSFADYGPRPPTPQQGYNQGQNTTQFNNQMQGNRGRWNGNGQGDWNTGNQRDNWHQGQSRGFPNNQRGNWHQGQSRGFSNNQRGNQYQGQASPRGRVRSIDQQQNNGISTYPYPDLPQSSQQSSLSNQSNVRDKEEDEGIDDTFYTAVRSIKMVE